MLGNLSITFGQPWWLILIPLILPPLVWLSYGAWPGLGRSAARWRSCCGQRSSR